MSDDFQKLRGVIQGETVGAYVHACYQRLRDAMSGLGLPQGAGPGDLSTLVRHVLRREGELQRGRLQTLRVPRGGSWPDSDGWDLSGVKVLDESSNDFLIEAHPWKPDWLLWDEGPSPEAAAFAESPRRWSEPVLGDPCLRVVGRSKYHNVGQRNALRAALLAPPKSTLVINLPTGAGKSLCAHLPALIASKPFGVSVVIVPTIALAIDQQRALRGVIDHDTAYYGDTSEAGRSRRQGIAERIRNGTQRIVFASPESLLGSLSRPLYDAAQYGFLKVVAVDEAHIVDQWGDEFRSAFQAIPGLRRDLLRASGENSSFITLLMTATLTEQCLDTLETLFGDPGPFEVVSSVQLRPEPSYWFARCENEQQRESRVLEAIRHLPRQLILYTTRIADAYRWESHLRTAGFTRVRVVTGESKPEYRQRAIEDWRSRKLDIIVATSAFGLGVDQTDVRAVVHACVPETIDRFYQEVGRGGRDGKASISLTIYTDDDVKDAENMNQRVLIGVERGLERWQSMFAAKEVFVDGRFNVPLTAVPTFGPRDINMDNKLNREWNVRTLNLMNRAGLIMLDSTPPPTQSFDEIGSDNDEKYLKALQSYKDSRVIRITNNDHLRQEVWGRRVEPLRQKILTGSETSLMFMEKALEGKKCLSHLFSEVYEIYHSDHPTKRTEVRVAAACGGCPHCRARQNPPFADEMPSNGFGWKINSYSVGPELQRFMGNSGLLAIFYSSSGNLIELERRRRRVSGWLVRQGLRNIVSTADVLGTLVNVLTDDPHSLAFFHENYDRFEIANAPTLIFHDHGKPIPDNYPLRTEAFEHAAPIVLLLPSEATDPKAGHRRVMDIFNGRSFNFEEFCAEIGL